MTSPRSLSWSLFGTKHNAMSGEQIPQSYSLDVPGLHARIGDLEARISVMTQVLQRLIVAFDMPAFKANVEAANSVLGSLLKSASNVTKHMEVITAYRETEEDSGGEMSPTEMAELAAMMGGGMGGKKG